MSLRKRYQGNQLRLAIQYRKAAIPEGFWFHEYPNTKQIDQACEHLDKGHWIVVFSRDLVVQHEFIADVLKRRQRNHPKFIDFGSFILSLTGRYSKYDLLSDDGFGLLGLAGIRPSSYYKELVGEIMTYLGKAFAKSNAGLILGFQHVDEAKLRPVYGAEMIDFIENPKFVYFKL